MAGAWDVVSTEKDSTTNDPWGVVSSTPVPKVSPADIEKIAKQHGVPPELAVAVAKTESAYDPLAKSNKGAQGIMQLMPDTAKRYGVKDSYDPQQNIEGGVKYLADLLKQFNGDQDKALAAYNWGEQNVAAGKRIPGEVSQYVYDVKGHADQHKNWSVVSTEPENGSGWNVISQQPDTGAAAKPSDSTRRAEKKPLAGAPQDWAKQELARTGVAAPVAGPAAPEPIPGRAGYITGAPVPETPDLNKIAKEKGESNREAFSHSLIPHSEQVVEEHRKLAQSIDAKQHPVMAAIVDADVVGMQTLIGLSTPGNLALLASMAFLPEEAAIKKLIDAGFSLSMAKQAYQQFKAGHEAGEKGDTRERRRQWLGGALSTVFAGLAAHGAAKGEKPTIGVEKPSETPVEAPKAAGEPEPHPAAETPQEAPAAAAAPPLEAAKPIPVSEPTPEPVKEVVEAESTPEAEAAATPHSVVRVPTGALVVDPKRFQYKLNVDESGTTNLLKGRKWNENLAGIVTAWFDPQTEETYVVNGHHRVQLAKDNGVPDILVKYIDAPDAATARTAGALQNIAEGRGNAIDAAKFLRDTGRDVNDLEREGITITEAMAERGIALARLADPIFDDVATGKMRMGRGVAIGRATEDPAQQEAILKLIQKREKSGRAVTDDVVQELGRMAKGSPKKTERQDTLFGVQEMTRNLLLEKAEISEYVRKQLAQEKRLFGGVSTEATASELKDEENPNAVKQRAYEDIRKALAETLQQPVEGRDQGVQATPERPAEAAAVAPWHPVSVEPDTVAPEKRSAIEAKFNFPPPKEKLSAWRRASENKQIAKEFERLGIDGFTVDSPHLFDLGEQANIERGTGKMSVSAAAEDPEHSIGHELAHDIYNRLSDEDRSIVDQYLLDHPSIEKQHSGGLEERIADHMADVMQDKAKLPENVRKAFFDSEVGDRPKSQPRLPEENREPEPRTKAGAWEDIKDRGGYILDTDNLAELSREGGERSVVIKDTFGGRHIMPSSVAAKVLDSDASGYVREVFLARSQDNPGQIAIDKGTGAKPLHQTIERESKALPESKAPTLPGMEHAVAEQKAAAGEAQAEKLTAELSQAKAQEAPKAAQEVPAEASKPIPVSEPTPEPVQAVAEAESTPEAEAAPWHPVSVEPEHPKIEDPDVAWAKRQLEYAKQRGDDSEVKEMEKRVSQAESKEKERLIASAVTLRSSLFGLEIAVEKAPPIVKDFVVDIQKEHGKVRTAKEIEDGLFDLQKNVEADHLEAIKLMKQAGGTPEDWEAIYHWRENPKEPLTAEQQKLAAEYDIPIAAQNRELYRKLTDNEPDEQHIHRVVEESGSWIDRLVSSISGKAPRGNVLSKSAASLKHRTMMAIEAEPSGRRQVVSIKGNRITGNSGEDLGALGGGLTTKLKLQDERLAPVVDKIGTLTEEIDELPAKDRAQQVEDIDAKIEDLKKKARVLASVRGRAVGQEAVHGIEVSFGKRKAITEEIEKLEKQKAEIQAATGEEKMSNRGQERIRRARESLTVAENQRDRILESVPAERLTDQVWVDKNGKKWKITQATTKEIESAVPDLRYYHNALASDIAENLELRRAERAERFIEGLKESPEFANYAIKDTGRMNRPEGYAKTNLPQLKDYFFEQHVADVLNRFADDLRGGDVSALEKIGDFLTTSIFLNPLIHVPNIAVHWSVEKGKLGFGGLLSPLSPEARDAGVKAINAVIHQNDDYVEALRSGAPLQSHRTELQQMQKLLFEKLGRELLETPSITDRIGDAFGYLNPVKMIKAWYGLSGRITWVTNDVAFMQAVYEKTANGMDMKEAISETAKHIPDYRIPTRVLDSPMVSRIMRNPLMSMFMAYHYGTLKSYGEAAKSALGISELPSSRTRPQEVRHGLDILTGIGITTFVLYPLADQIVKYLSGDDKARMRRAGATTFPFNMYLLSKGERTPTEVMESIFTPAIVGKEGVELFANRDLRTGRKIYDPHAKLGEELWQLRRFGGASVAPIQSGMNISEREDGLKKFAWSLFGVSFPLSGSEKLAMEYKLQGLGNEAPTEENTEKAALMYDLRLDAKKGKIDKIREAQKKHEITPIQASHLIEDAKREPLIGMLRGAHLTYDQFMQIYDKAKTENHTPETMRILNRMRMQQIAKHNKAVRDRQPQEVSKPTSEAVQ